ncbi:methylamine utilization protein [Pseudidiomarina sediminum]|uniref:methylamine utilization protein n=1 Tax=Pseudidiomarina sediminum TaxID=431675 RepID=UPI001C959347|nr:methylamine utilization protein [Pseudidiomarina sediminum]MBY6063412.1 methylamine utilization protein [Pseudidiomarina sediminum]
MRYFQWLIYFVGLCCMVHSSFASERQVTITVVDAAQQPLPQVVISSHFVGPQQPASTATIDQVDRLFEPFISVVATGAAIDFPNRDNIRHQVFSFSPAKPFELPLYGNVTAPAVDFPKPGVVVLGCNIHDHMRAYIYVSPHPQSLLTDAKGQATLTLPEQAAALQLWYPGLGDTPEAEVTHTVPAQEKAWRIQLKVTPQQQVTPPQSPLQQRFNQLQQHVH